MDLYSSIKAYVPLMPDFRPQKTIKMFKDEKQDNWSKIAHELESLHYNADHVKLLNAINSGEENRIYPFYTDEEREIVSDFIFSYPALVWFMIHISPKKTIMPLLVSSGESLFPHLSFYLEEISVTERAIFYLRDEKTARIFYGKEPEIFPLNKEDYILWVRNGITGKILWALQSPEMDTIKINTFTLRRAIENGYECLASIILSRGKAKITEISFYNAVFSNCIRIVKLLLENGIVNIDRVSPRALDIAVLADYTNMVSFLLESSPLGFHHEILSHAIRNGNVEILQLLLKDRRMVPDSKDISSVVLLGKKESLQILLDHYNGSPVDNDLLQATLLNKPEIVRIILSYSSINPNCSNNRPIIYSMRNKQIECVSLLLNSDGFIMNENIRKTAQKTKDSRIIGLVNKKL